MHITSVARPTPAWVFNGCKAQVSSWQRIADRATNIAERVIFLVSGKLVEINVSRY